jgi:hypothetical protein
MKSTSGLILVVLLVVGCSRELDPAIVAQSPQAQCSFLAVGRQGYGNRSTRQIADAMEQVARQRGDVHFALLLGDNFYPAGVKSVADRQWTRKFESLYRGPHLRGMPFYAVLGNHDHQGSIEAQLKYSMQRMGSGRWSMDAPFYARDFGEVDGRPLVRIAFLDSVSLQGTGTDGPIAPELINAAEQIEFLRAEFGPNKVRPYWRVIASHYPARSHTKISYSQERIMSKLLPVIRETEIDLFISANDRFQHFCDVPGESLYVGTNGGGQKLEKIAARDTGTEYVLSQRGFGLVSIDKERLKVELFAADGTLSHTGVRRREHPAVVDH